MGPCLGNINYFLKRVAALTGIDNFSPLIFLFFWLNPQSRPASLATSSPVPLPHSSPSKLLPGDLGDFFMNRPVCQQDLTNGMGGGGAGEGGVVVVVDGTLLSFL